MTDPMVPASTREASSSVSGQMVGSMSVPNAVVCMLKYKAQAYSQKLRMGLDYQGSTYPVMWHHYPESWRTHGVYYA